MPRKTKTNKSLKYHAVHKGKMGLLLILKVVLVLLSFFLVMAAVSLLAPWVNFDQISFINILVWAVSFAIVLGIYLFVILRVLHVFKFK